MNCFIFSQKNEKKDTILIMLGKQHTTLCFKRLLQALQQEILLQELTYSLFNNILGKLFPFEKSHSQSRKNKKTAKRMCEAHIKTIDKMNRNIKKKEQQFQAQQHMHQQHMQHQQPIHAKQHSMKTIQEKPQITESDDISPWRTRSVSQPYSQPPLPPPNLKGTQQSMPSQLLESQQNIGRMGNLTHASSYDNNSNIAGHSMRSHSVNYGNLHKNDEITGIGGPHTLNKQKSDPHSMQYHHTYHPAPPKQPPPLPPGSQGMYVYQS